jgi:hypothetical protein
MSLIFYRYPSQCQEEDRAEPQRTKKGKPAPALHSLKNALKEQIPLRHRAWY